LKGEREKMVSLWKEYTVTFDICGRNSMDNFYWNASSELDDTSLFSTIGRRDALKIVKEHGWKRMKGKDICQNCQKEPNDADR